MFRLVAAIATALTIAAGISVARDVYESYIPNSDYTFRISGNTTSCQTCHVGPSNGPLNAFGADVKATLREDGRPDWKALAALDSDGDGQPNGYELGDPSGDWRIGNQRPYGTVTNPADARSSSDAPLAIQRVQVPTSWAVIKALFQ